MKAVKVGEGRGDMFQGLGENENICSCVLE